jgi:uncharacterized protein (DUF885 family)
MYFRRLQFYLEQGQNVLSSVPFSNPNAHGAYYLRPSLDGSEPGKLFVHLASTQPNSSIPTLATPC